MIFFNENNSLLINQVLDLLAEEAHFACLLLSLDREILYLNDLAASMYSWDRSQVVGKNFSRLCQNQGVDDICLKYIPEITVSQPIKGIVHELTVKDKPLMVIEWSFLPIKDASGQVISILIVGADIRKNLQDKNSYLYNIMNNVPHTIFWKNRESVFLGCNETFARLAQLSSPEDIVGLTDYDLPWDKSESDAYRADDQAVMAADQPRFNIEEKQTLADGATIILLTSKVPLHDKWGQVNGVLGVYTDITEQKKIEHRLKKAKQDADELKRLAYLLEGAKLISSAIAHEIRTPLATIKSIAWNTNRGLTKLIPGYEQKHTAKVSNDIALQEEIDSIKKGLDNINKKVDQSNKIINMLLTKLQNIDFEFSEFGLLSAVSCIQDAINEFNIPNKLVNKIKFSKENDFNFLGNQVLIIHVILNLLKNAVFYILKAGKGEITIWLENHEQFNEIHFKDTGTGIKKQILSSIFDSFFTTESSTGTGVGLAFCKMVMQSHKGTIDCFSVEGEYTEFLLSFPVCD